MERKFQEPLMVTCTLPPPTPTAHHQISCINLNSNLKLSKCTLGFDSENRLFKSQRLQAALAFCHKNVENWYREVRLVPNLRQEPTKENNSDKKASENKQIITKEVLEKFPKSKKWYKHFKILGNNELTEKYEDIRDPMDGMEKGKSIDRYKDMSKLIEEKFGRKSYNPVKKSASFMFSSKRIDLEEISSKPALLKCQSLDTQLSVDESSRIQRRNSRSNVSDNLSYDFRMCILDNENDKIEELPKLRKSKPDLIPTLPKPEDSSYITKRLYSEFHVKTKLQKKMNKSESNIKSVSVQIHESRSKSLVEEVPYSKVADEVITKPRRTSDENIYAEICETAACEVCDNKCECKQRTKKSSEYCYVKLGSNGDSVTQSDSDEAIYNTLR